MTGSSTGAPAAPRRARGGVVLLVAALLATTGCGPDGGDAVPTVTRPAEVEASKVAPPAPAERPAEPEPEPVWPLTGVKTGGKKPAARPALAVKIENSPESRPHSGLHEADIVWEQVVEGGISRFVAVYHSKRPRSVGPIRSVRPMDPGIVAPMDGILAYTGAQKPFIAGVRRAGVQSVIMDDGDPGFWRSSDRYTPHNVYGSVRSFWEQGDKRRTAPPPAQFRYAASVGKGTASAHGRRARVADVRLSPAQRTVWEYRAERRGYVRSDGGTPSRSSGARVAARNVLLLSVRMENTGYRDPSGAPVPKVRMVDRGTGMLLSSGKAVKVRWKKTGVRKKLVLTQPSGKPVALDPGNLWVELVPRGSGAWKVR